MFASNRAESAWQALLKVHLYLFRYSSWQAYARAGESSVMIIPRDANKVELIHCSFSQQRSTSQSYFVNRHASSSSNLIWSLVGNSKFQLNFEHFYEIRLWSSSWKRSGSNAHRILHRALFARCTQLRLKILNLELTLVTTVSLAILRSPSCCFLHHRSCVIKLPLCIALMTNKKRS